MTDSTSPRDGDYGLTQIGGLLGVLVSLGQMIIGDSSRFTHAFVVVDAANGIAVEARPGGAVLVNYVEEYVLHRGTSFSHLDLTDDDRFRIVAAAKALLGRGYNWLDYVYLSLARLGWRPAWLLRKVGNRRRLICSQLVDEAYRIAGVHLFEDGRPSQDVTPGDLTYVGHVY